MVRKILAVLIAAMAALLPLSALAQARIEQVQVVLPDVVAYVHAEGADMYYSDGEKQQLNEMSAALGAQQLTMTEGGPAEVPMHYYLLVDCSGSIRKAQMAAVREALLYFANERMPDERVTLITFGTSVEVVLDSTENDEQIKEAISLLQADQSETLFYDALAVAAEKAGTGKYGLDRKVAFVFSDGVDENLGGYTKAEVDALLGTAQLPIYAFGFDTGKKAELDNFGAVARQSGGEIRVVSARGLFSAVREGIDKARGTYALRFKAANNIIEGSPLPFVLEIGDARLETQVAVKHWQADTIAPRLALAASRRTTPSRWFSARR